MKKNNIHKTRYNGGLRGLSVFSSILFLLVALMCINNPAYAVTCFVLALLFFVCLLVLNLRATFASSSYREVEILRFLDDYYLFLSPDEFCWGKPEKLIQVITKDNSFGIISDYFFLDNFKDHSLSNEERTFTLHSENIIEISEGLRVRIPMHLIFYINNTFSAKKVYETMINSVSDGGSLPKVIVKKFNENNKDLFESIKSLYLNKISGKENTEEEIENVTKIMPVFPKEIFDNIYKVEVILDNFLISIK